MKIHQLVRAGHVLLIGLALLVLAGSAQAAFITPSDLATGGWTRGDAGTTYQQWQPYPYAYGAPPVVSQNSAGTATVTATNPAAGTYPAGSGNLYSPAGALPGTALLLFVIPLGTYTCRSSYAMHTHMHLLLIVAYRLSGSGPCHIRYNM